MPAYSDDFQRDDVWQRGIRDRILGPAFYGRHSLDGRYVFVDQGEMATLAERRSSVDTLAHSRRTGRMLRIEEKIIRHPRVLPRFSNYLLETVSCTVIGRESPGWMVYSTADRLLYAFCTNPDETELDVRLLDMPKLKAWFWLREKQFQTFVNDTINRTKVCKVPFDVVPTEILLWRGIVREPTDIEADFEAFFAPRPMSRAERQLRAWIDSGPSMRPTPAVIEAMQPSDTGWRTVFRYGPPEVPTDEVFAALGRAMIIDCREARQARAAEEELALAPLTPAGVQAKQGDLFT